MSGYTRAGSGLYVPDSYIEDWRQTPSGLYLPNRACRYDRPTCVGLFCGAGGMSCGMVQAGFHEVAAVEWSPDASLTYMTNLGAYPIHIHYIEPGDEDRLNACMEREMKRKAHTPELERFMRSGGGWISLTDRPGCEEFFFGDIRKLSGQAILDAVGLMQGEIDVVTGGPPCQGLSSANMRRKMEDPRNGLLWEYMRMVEEIRPKAFVMENVPALLTAGEGGLFKLLCKKANDAGYGVVGNVVDASNYGVPQYRRRAIIVGRLGNEPYQFPMPTNWTIGAYPDGHAWNQLRGAQEEEKPTEVQYDEDSGTFKGGTIGRKKQPAIQESMSL